MLRFARTAQTVKDTAGIEYLVEKANSYAVQLASHIRKTTMADGTDWMTGSSRVGQPITIPIAWRP